MTKNENLRIDLWRWASSQGGKLDSTPIFTILPFKLAQKAMEDVEYDF